MRYGQKWQQISEHVPGRSANAVRNRFLRCCSDAINNGTAASRVSGAAAAANTGAAGGAVPQIATTCAPAVVQAEMVQATAVAGEKRSHEEAMGVVAEELDEPVAQPVSELEPLPMADPAGVAPLE